jgi:hypothetical protein
VPAIVIASSPHKVVRAETPWQDTFEPDRRIDLSEALEIESEYGDVTEVTNPDDLTFSGWPIDPAGAPTKDVSSPRRLAALAVTREWC